MRSSAPVRAVLCAAALLSLVAAFGLHPEPAGSSAPTAEPGIAARATLAAPAHGCIACLNGGTAMVTAPGGLAPAAADSAPAAARRSTEPPARLACGNLPGRSPPAVASS